MRHSASMSEDTNQSQRRGEAFHLLQNIPIMYQTFSFIFIQVIIVNQASLEGR